VLHDHYFKAIITFREDVLYLFDVYEDINAFLCLCHFQCEAEQKTFAGCT